MAQTKRIHLPSVADANVAQCGASVPSAALRFPKLDATKMCIPCFIARLRELNSCAAATAPSTAGA